MKKFSMLPCTRGTQLIFNCLFSSLELYNNFFQRLLLFLMTPFITYRFIIYIVYIYVVLLYCIIRIIVIQVIGTQWIHWINMKHLMEHRRGRTLSSHLLLAVPPTVPLAVPVLEAAGRAFPG